MAAPTIEGRCWDLDVLNVTLSSIPAPYAKRYDSAQVDRPNAHLKGNLKMCMGKVLGKKKKGMVWRWVDRRLRVAYCVLLH